MSEKRGRIDFPARVGVWWASDTWSMPAAQEVAAEIEQLGYGSLFIPEVGLKDCMVESAAFLAATERLVIGTGIANIHARVDSAYACSTAAGDSSPNRNETCPPHSWLFGSSPG